MADMTGVFAQAKTMYGEHSSQGQMVFDLEQLWFRLQSDHVEDPPNEDYPLDEALLEAQSNGDTYTLKAAQAKLQKAIDAGSAQTNNAFGTKNDVLEAVVVFQVLPSVVMHQQKV